MLRLTEMDPDLEDLRITPQMGLGFFFCFGFFYILSKSETTV